LAVHTDATVVISLMTTCSSGIVAFVGSGFAAFQKVEDYLPFGGFLAAQFKPAITACSCLRQQSGFASTCRPEGDGGIREWTTVYLHLPLDPNRGRCPAARAPYHADGHQYAQLSALYRS
jgi:hypothetical protein